jgi:L-seryl-tRNA(Ser) seleniumtransferase
LTSRRILCDVIETDASVGGGSFPMARIPSAAIALSGNAEQVDIRLRAGDPPVVSRIIDGRVVLDVRTIQPGVDDELIELVERALG